VRGRAAVRSVLEGYYVESTEGLLFAVKGLIHPPQAVVAYLRYAPDPDGDREKGDVRYRRLYHFEEQEELLRERYPAYLFFDPVFGERLQGVPYERIKQVYDPCLKLAQLRRRKGLDDLEEKAVEFAGLLRTKAKVPKGSIGISGSILVGLHTTQSDQDLIVYGSENCRAVHETLRELLDQPSSGVERLDQKGLEELYAFRSRDTPMGFEDFVRLEGRKVIQGRFWGCEYFIRFVKASSEVGERYGNRRYVPLGSAEIRARVTDDTEAIFTPCAYRTDEVQFLEGAEVSDLNEIASFRGRFCEQAKEGEWVVARGKLERVSSKREPVYYRLLVGRPGDRMTVERFRQERRSEGKCIGGHRERNPRKAPGRRDSHRESGEAPADKHDEGDRGCDSGYPERNPNGHPGGGLE
jgi:predicted nucleotidyltransferase